MTVGPVGKITVVNTELYIKLKVPEMWSGPASKITVFNFPLYPNSKDPDITTGPAKITEDIPQPMKLAPICPNTTEPVNMRGVLAAEPNASKFRYPDIFVSAPLKLRVRTL